MPLRLLPTPPASEIPHLSVLYCRDTPQIWGFRRRDLLHSWRSYRPRSRLSTLSKTNYRCSSERLKSEEDNQWLTRLSTKLSSSQKSPRQQDTVRPRLTPCLVGCSTRGLRRSVTASR